MGSMPQHSILKGSSRALSKDGEPVELHKIFEHVVDELDKIHKDNNNTEKYVTIHGITLSHEMLQNPALVFGEKIVSYEELNNQANQLARVIAVSIYSQSDKYINKDGDLIVAVAIPPSDDLIVTLLACWKIGAAYLPIDPTFPQARIDHIIRESEPALVIMREKDQHLFSSGKAIPIESLQKLAADADTDNLKLSDYVTGQVPQTAIVLYTSGSTGIPKGVRLSHPVILNRLKWQWETFPYSDTERVAIFKTALTFVDSVSEIWGPLLNARTLLVVPKEESKDAEKIIDLLERYKIERLVLVPTLLQSILLYLPRLKANNSQSPLSKLRLWVCSGEILSSNLAQEFYKHFDIRHHKLCNFYGSTEVMGDVTYHVIDDPDEVAAVGKVPIGRPTHNSVIYLLDDKMNPVNVGETGEIYVSGGNLAMGYVKNRDAHRFIDNNIVVASDHRKLYLTGDYGRIYKNTLYYEGRKDSQIKIRGNRIDLAEIDEALKKVPVVKQEYVLAYNPGERDQAVLAFVTLNGNGNRAEVEKALNNLLPAYMVPVIVVIEEFPLLVNGKVDRQFLLNFYRSGSFNGTKEAIDFQNIQQSDLEKAKVVFETLKEVLGNSLRDRISTESSFFSLGGNSLNAVYFVTKLHDLGYAISIRDFLSAPTLGDVIQRVTVYKEAVPLTDDAAIEDLKTKYKREQLSNENFDEYLDILCTSFYEKADLEQFLDPGVTYNDYVRLIRHAAPQDIGNGLSYVVRDRQGQIIGACMNKDAYFEVDVSDLPPSRLDYVLGYLDTLEHRALESLPKGEGKILHNFMMGSKKGLSAQETIELFIFMEEELLNLAKSLKFEGVFTTNTSPLTQQLATDVNDYQVLLTDQANLYIADDNTQPFQKAPDSLIVKVCWKTI